MMEKILFIPELELDLSQAPKDVTVKGQLPYLDYPFTLRDIYPVVPALDPFSAYERIREEFAKVDDILSQGLKLRGSFRLPHISDDEQALTLLSILFDPTCYYTDGLWQKLVVSTPANTDILRLDEARPFPLRLASPQKLIHTLVWIDTNIKVTVENVIKPYHPPVSTIQQIVESALKIYAYLVKQQDYWLARSMNFNFSMFLQDRILNLIFGDNIYLATSKVQTQGKLANHIALQLLKNLGDLSYRQLCTLGVFMGVIWTSREDIQQDFLTNPGITLGHIDTQLNVQQTNWCIDHIDQFLADLGTPFPITVAVILDDNGESVFDVALFQRLLNDTGTLQVTFVVNRYPISNNIALETFQTLLKDTYFADLRQHLKQGRATLCVEQQVFRSFELAHLQSQTHHTIKNSQLTYIKGVNFFETFQFPNVVRYHCFTVYGRTSTLLTGCPEGKGVFAKLHPNQTGYTYHSYTQIEMLRDKVANRGENHALQSPFSH